MNKHHRPIHSQWLALMMGAMMGLPSLAQSAPRLLLDGAVVHTISGPDLAPGQVLIEGGKIKAVGERVEARDAQVVNLAGHHLYPGLIAANTTLGLVEIDAVRASRDAVEVGGYTPDVRSWIAVNPDSELIPVARANGITHFQANPLGGLVSGLSGVLATHGWTTESMIVRVPAGLHVDWPSLSLDTRPKSAFPDPSKWKSLKDQARDRRRSLQELKDFFAEAVAYNTARKADEDQWEVPAWEAMKPVVESNLPVMITADEFRQIRSVIEWATNHAYKVVLMGGRDAWREAEALAKANIPVVYDHTFTLPPKDTDDYDVQFKAPAVLADAGVTVIFGTGLGGADEPSSLRNLPYAAAQAVAHGLPEAEALKGMTLNPARLLGLSDRLGSIEAGKEASLIAVNGSLLDLRANVTRMWIAGQPVSLESRHTRLYEKYKARPR